VYVLLATSRSLLVVCLGREAGDAWHQNFDSGSGGWAVRWCSLAEFQLKRRKQIGKMTWRVQQRKAVCSARHAILSLLPHKGNHD